MSVFNVEPDYPVGVSLLNSANVAVTNTAGGTVYYADNQNVSATNNQGSLTVGQTATFTQQMWLRSASRSTVSAAYGAASSVTYTALQQAQPFIVDTPENHGAARDGVTDDTAAIQAAINNVIALGQANGSYYGEVWFSQGTYAVNGPVTGNGSPNYAYSQIVLPYLLAGSTAPPVFTLVLKGASLYSARPYFQTNVNQVSGTTLKSNLNQAWSGGTGHASVIGGPVGEQNPNNNPTGLLFSNMLLVIEGLNIVVGANKNGACLNLQEVGQVHVKSCSLNASYPAQLDPSTISNDSYGIIMPSYGNMNNAVVDTISIGGFSKGFVPGEHTVVNRAYIYGCTAGVYALSSAQYVDQVWFGYLSTESCLNYIDCTPMSGPALLQFNINVACWDIEDDGTGNQASLTHIKDPTNALCGEIHYQRYNTSLTGSGLVAVQSNLIMTGGSQVRLYNIRQNPGHVTSPSFPSSGSPLTNPFDRDAFVSYSSVTGMAVNGVSTGLSQSAGTCFVPSRQTITPTYTSGQTWTWWVA